MDHGWGDGQFITVQFGVNLARWEGVGVVRGPPCGFRGWVSNPPPSSLVRPVSPARVPVGGTAVPGGEVEAQRRRHLHRRRQPAAGGPGGACALGRSRGMLWQCHTATGVLKGARVLHSMRSSVCGEGCILGHSGSGELEHHHRCRTFDAPAHPGKKIIFLLTQGSKRTHEKKY